MSEIKPLYVYSAEQATDMFIIATQKALKHIENPNSAKIAGEILATFSIHVARFHRVKKYFGKGLENQKVLGPLDIIWLHTTMCIDARIALYAKDVSIDEIDTFLYVQQGIYLHDIIKIDPVLEQVDKEQNGRLQN